MSHTTTLAYILILLKMSTFSTSNGQSLDANVDENCFKHLHEMLKSIHTNEIEKSVELSIRHFEQYIVQKIGHDLTEQRATLFSQTQMLHLQETKLENIKALIENHIKQTTDESRVLEQSFNYVLLKFNEIKESVYDATNISNIEHSVSTIKEEHLHQNSSFNDLMSMLTELDRVTVNEDLAMQQQFQELENTLTTKEISSCEEAYKGEGGIYRIYLPKSLLKSFNAYCQPDSSGGSPWTIIQRRVDNSTDFYRGWNDYKEGFGNVSGNFWIGLEKIYALTWKQSHELWILMEDFEGKKLTANYSAFAIGSEDSKYKVITEGDYIGDAGHMLQMYKNKFSTFDSDNDVSDNENCAIVNRSAWWFDNCHRAHLNGDYIFGKPEKPGHGIIWNTFGDNFNSLKFAQMAIRPIT